MMTTQSPEGTDFDEARRRAHAAARTRWPEIGLTLNQFSSHLQRLGWVHRLPPHTDELYLCCGCNFDVREACRRLDADYIRELEASLARQCRRRDFVEEILQQVRERLLVGPKRRIASFRGEGPLSSWLRRVAHHAASDLYRREQKQRRLACATGRYRLELMASPDVEATGSHPIVGHLERAFRDAMEQLPADDRRLLYLHYVLGLSVDEIGWRLDRDRSNVYRRLSQIRALVKRRSVANAEKQTGIRDRDELNGLFHANCLGIYLNPAVWIDLGSAEADDANTPKLRRG